MGNFLSIRAINARHFLQTVLTHLKLLVESFTVFRSECCKTRQSKMFECREKYL